MFTASKLCCYIIKYQLQEISKYTEWQHSNEVFYVGTFPDIHRWARTRHSASNEHDPNSSPAEPLQITVSTSFLHRLTWCLIDQQVWFPGDIFTNILTADIHLAGSLTPEITLILFTQSIAQLTDIYWGLLTAIPINPGLLRDVFYWYTVIHKNLESY